MKATYKQVLFFGTLIIISSNFLHPVTPTFFTMLKLPEHVFGTSLAMMLSGIFLFSPWWGSLGDRISRKKTLTIALFFYGVAQILLGISNTLWQVLLIRFIAGVFSAGFTVGIMAMVVDVSTDEDRAKNIAGYAAMLSISASIGFLIGGLLGFLPVRWVFYIQGLTMMLLSACVYLFLNETNPIKDLSSRPIFVWNILRDIDKRRDVFTKWGSLFLAITLLAFFANAAGSNAFNYYLRKELEFQPIVNGVYRALIGITGLIINTTFNVWLVKNTNLRNSIKLVLLGMVSTAVFVLFAKAVPLFIAWNFLFSVAFIAVVPILQSFAVENKRQGAGFMSGVFNGTRALGEMLGATTSGFAYGAGAMLPFIITAFASALAFLLSLLKIDRGE